MGMLSKYATLPTPGSSSIFPFISSIVEKTNDVSLLVPVEKMPPLNVAFRFCYHLHHWLKQF